MKNIFISIDQNKNKPPYRSTSIIFRRTFNVKKTASKYLLDIAGLGIGTYYLNGKRITNNILNQAVSNYLKTVWVDTYNVTKLLVNGKNVFVAEIGNGFFNECLDTPWHFDKAPWRNEKMLYFKLKENNEIILQSDTSFKVKYSLFRTYNELRSGECVDYNFYEDYANPNYDDSNWENAVFTNALKKTKLRKLNCPKINEFEKIKPIKIMKNNDGYLVDFGVNMSGYISIKVRANKNQEITLKFAEDIKDNELDLHGIDCFQKNELFQTIIIKNDGKLHVFKPEFTYFGFRYVQINGYKKTLKDNDIKAFFTHQNIHLIKDAKTNDKDIQKLFNACVRSILSNTYYSLTDCPTREKLGWGNDAQNTLPFLCQYFNCKQLLKKWMRDIVDTVNDDGSIPGIFPSPNWGYEYGPMMCGGIIFSLPYFYKKYFGSNILIKMVEKKMRLVYKYFENISLDSFVLADWTGSTSHPDTPKEFIYDLFMYIYSFIMNHEVDNSYKDKEQIYRDRLLKYKPYGQCMSSSLLVLNIGNKEENLKALKKAILKSDYHIDCGMCGTAFLFRALFENDMKKELYRMVFNPTKPSYKYWLDKGLTTLPENIEDKDVMSNSYNHHMYSNIMEYLLK